MLMLDDVEEKYNTGDRVEVSFWTGHLQNGYAPGEAYFRIARIDRNESVEVASDNDWETRLYWTQPDAPKIDPYIATGGDSDEPKPTGSAEESEPEPDAGAPATGHPGG